MLFVIEMIPIPIEIPNSFYMRNVLRNCKCIFNIEFNSKENFKEHNKWYMDMLFANVYHIYDSN